MKLNQLDSFRAVKAIVLAQLKAKQIETAWRSKDHSGSALRKGKAVK